MPDGNVPARTREAISSCDRSTASPRSAHPAAAAQGIAARVQGAHLTLLPGEGHFLVFDRWREILAWLLQ